MTVIHPCGLSPQDPQTWPFSLRPVTLPWPRTPISLSPWHILSRKGDCQGARHFSGEDIKAEALAPTLQYFWTSELGGAGLPLPTHPPVPNLGFGSPRTFPCASPHENFVVRQIDIFKNRVGQATLVLHGEHSTCPRPAPSALDRDPSHSYLSLSWFPKGTYIYYV